MAFAQVASSAPYGGTTTTTHPVTNPSGIASGNVLVMCISTRVDATITLPTGWVIRFQIADGSGGTRSAVAYKIADGTEGATTTVTLSVSGELSACTYRITGHDPANPPQAASFTTTYAANKNPPSLAPSWGAGDTLWIAGISTRGSTAPSVRPTGYGNSVNSSVGAGHEVWTDRRELNTATEDPSIYTSTNTWYVAFTIAIASTSAVIVPLACNGTGAATGSATLSFREVLEAVGTGIATGAAALSISFSLSASGSGVATGSALLLLTKGIAAIGSGIATGLADLTKYEGTAYFPGLREFEPGFSSPFVQSPQGISFTRRPDAISFDYLTAFSQGPKAIADVTEGASSRPWYVRIDNSVGSVFIAKANNSNTAWEAESLLFTFNTAFPILECDLAFEQAARAVVCAQRNTGVGGTPEAWLYWFKPLISAFIFESFGSGRTPRIVLDDPEDQTNADVQLFYMKPTVGLVRLEQRDAYGIEYSTPVPDSADFYLEDVFTTRGRRVAVVHSRRDQAIGRYFLQYVESKLYPAHVRNDVLQLLTSLQESSSLYVALIIQTMDAEKLAVLPALQATSTLTVVLITHSLFDKDKLAVLPAVQAAASFLVVVLIVHDLFDKDKLAILPAIQAAASSFLRVVIVHDLFDKDKLQVLPAVQETQSSLIVV